MRVVLEHRRARRVRARFSRAIWAWWADGRRGSRETEERKGNGGQRRSEDGRVVCARIGRLGRGVEGE